jgi:molecular chaperone DnaK
MEIFGIDFGTTNSATVGILGRTPRRYGYADRPFPSIVAIDRLTGEVIARGLDAWKRRGELDANCAVITSPKSYLGTNHAWKIGGMEWTPVDIASEVFKGLRLLAKERGACIRNAMVAIPVGLPPAKRRDVRRAAALAGIEVAGFVSEPTAAVLRNFNRIRRWSRVAVFDWGGGTLDISVVELRGKNVRELAAIGIELGGDKFDAKIAEWAHEQHLRSTGTDLPFSEIDPSTRVRLLMQCEEAKCRLSNEDMAEILVANYIASKNLLVTITPQQLHSLLEQEYSIAENALKEAVCSRAGVGFDMLGCVLMVGGSSKLNGLYARIQSLVGNCEVIPPANDADWHVGEGAALLSGSPGRHTTTTNFGVELSDGFFFPLVRQDTDADDCRGSINFGITEDVQHASFNFYTSRDPNSITVNHPGMQRVGNMLVPCNGFVNEAIKLEYEVDKDLFLRLTARSNLYGASKITRWDFDQLLFTYSLPDE